MEIPPHARSALALLVPDADSAIKFYESGGYKTEDVKLVLPHNILPGFELLAQLIDPNAMELIASV